jgi:hypothetical protein
MDRCKAMRRARCAIMTMSGTGCIFPLEKEVWTGEMAKEWGIFQTRHFCSVLLKN